MFPKILSPYEDLCDSIWELPIWNGIMDTIKIGVMRVFTVFLSCYVLGLQDAWRRQRLEKGPTERNLTYGGK